MLWAAIHLSCRASGCEVLTNPKCFHVEFAALVFPMACQFGLGVFDGQTRLPWNAFQGCEWKGSSRCRVNAAKSRLPECRTHQEAQLTTDTETILSLVSFELHRVLAVRWHAWCSTNLSALRVAFHRSHRRDFFSWATFKGRRNNGVSVPAGDHFANASLDELW